MLKDARIGGKATVVRAYLCGVTGYTLDFGDEIFSRVFSSCYAEWAALYGLGAWNAAAASGIHNMFRYLFYVPIGAFTNPPLRLIAFDATGNPDGCGTPPTAATH